MSMPLAGQRIGLLTASASRLGGGVFEAVVAQAALIRNLGGEALIFALADAHSEADAARFAPGAVRLSPVFGPRQIGFAPDLVPDLLGAELDCLHLHGIWMYPSRAGTVWARRTGRRYIVSPHGMLDPWITGRGRWKKALARRGYERASWRAASTLHALTQDEAADIEREAGPGRVVVIPNAAPPLCPLATTPRDPVIAYLGRIHPKKNLASLLAAWTSAPRPAAARLEVAGWGEEADVAAINNLVAAAGPSVRFLGPLFGEDKRALFERARFTILPSLSEGLPMAVLESWAAGTPSLMSRACHLPDGFSRGAALDCGTDPSTIAATIDRALSFDHDSWLAMAHAAQALAGGTFSADRVARQWARAYGADEPDGARA